MSFPVLNRLAILLCFVSWSAGEVPAINSVIDEMLDDIKNELSLNGEEGIPSEDFETEFSYRVFEFKLRSNLDCRNASLRNFSSVTRTGDSVITNVVVSSEGNEVSIMVPLSFQDLNVAWEKCRIEVRHLVSQTKRMTVGYGENFVLAEIWLRSKVGEGCNASLTRLALSDPTKISIDGSGLVGIVLDRIYGLISDFVKTKVEGTVRGHLKEILTSHLPSKKLCQTFFRT